MRIKLNYFRINFNIFHNNNNIITYVNNFKFFALQLKIKCFYK